jgi:PKD repeat protein
MKKIYASLITLITFFQLNAQFSTDWSRSYVGNGGRIYNKSFIAADATDNAVVSFGFDVIDSLSSTSIPFSHPGGAITVKYSGATGTQTYIKNIEDKYTSLAGQVLQTAGSVTVALTNQSAGGNKDIRVYRYASAGTQTWLHTYNGPGNDNDFANDIALDLTGNALVCGTVDADNTTTRGLLVYKLNSANGNLLWQKNISSVGSIQNGLKVLTDGSSSVYTIYERITGSTKTYGVAGFLAAGTDLYNTSLTINGYTQVIFKDFSCDQSGNCYASFFGITNSNSYNLIVIKIDTNGIASNFLSTTLSGDANNANTRIKVEPNSAQILVAYDILSNNSVELKRYNSSALEVWNNNKALSTLNDVCFGNGVTPNVFLLSTVSGTDGNDISIARYNGGSGAFIGNTNYDIPLSNSIDKGLSINVSGSGNIFTSGTSSITQNGEKVFATRFNATATNQWTKSIVDFSDLNNSISRTSSGEIIVGGNSRNSSNVPAAYVTKYSSSGNELWRFQHGTYSNEINTGARQIASDSNGNIYFAGVETNSNRDIFLFKLNSSGRVIWKSVYNHTSNLEDLVSEIALDNLGNIILVGTTRQTSINRNVLVLKYNSSGNLVWNVSYDGPSAGDDFGRSLVINSSNEIYVGCELRNSGSQTDAAIIKLDASGNVVWTSINNDNFGDDLAVKIRLDNAGNPILLSNVLVSTGSYNGNIYKVSPSNSLIFSTNFGDNAVNEIINDFSLNSLNQIAVTGQSGNSPIDRNIFTARFSEVGLQNWISTFVGAGNANDFGHNCSISNNGTVYCGGTTKNASSNDDFILLCYDGSGTQQHFFNFGISGSSNEQASQLVFTDTKVFATGFSNSAANNDGLTAAFTLPILTNTAPTISTLATQTICTSVSSNSISITIADEDLNSVVLTGSSSNTSLISNSGLSFGGSGANRTLIITPALNQTGSSTITVTATDNGSLTNQIQFLVNVTGGPAATSIISDGAETFCNGQSVNIIVPPQTGVNYQWLQNGNNVGLNQNTINVSSSGTYSVVLSNNCSSITSSNSIAVSVNNPPSAPTISANGNTTFCTGGSVELRVPSASLVNYQWKIDGNNIGSNSNSLTATSAGVYTVELSNNCGTVASSNSISVIVNSAPTSATISANGSTTICSGNNVDLSVTSQTGVNYQWKIDGSNTGTNSNLLTATSAGVYTVELSNNCGTVVSTNSISMIVNSAPTSATISANGSTTICSGSNVNLSILSQIGVNYQWKIDGNNTGTNSNSLTANTAGIYTVELSNNCGTVVSTNSISVIVNSAPTSATISANGSTTICSGSNVNLSILSQIGVNYQWKIDGNNTGTNSNSLTATTAGVYTVELSNNCGTVVSSNSISVIVNSAPTAATISANGSTTICSGSNVELSVPLQAGVNYQWKIDANNLGTNSNLLTATSAGVYTVELSSNCGTVVSANSISVIVNSAPTSVTISANGSTTICSGNNVDLSVTSQTGVNYQWKIDANNLGTNSNLLTATSAGVYTVELSNNCGTVVSVNSISVIVNSAPTSATISANGSTTICSGSNVELSVPSQTGVNYQWKIDGSNTGTNSNLLTSTSAGVYTVELSNNCGTVVSANSIEIIIGVGITPPTITALGAIEICFGDSVELFTPFDNTFIYQWQLDGNNIFADTNSVFAELAGIYSLQVTNSCGTVNATNVIKVGVTEFPISQTIIANGPLSFCQGGTVLLSTDVIAGITNLWFLDGNSIGDPGNELTASQGGTYSMVSFNFCGIEPSLNTIDVNITPLPVAPIITSSATEIACSGGSVELSVSNQIGVNFSWKQNGNSVGTNSNTYTTSTPGVFTLEVSNSCGTVMSTNSVVITAPSLPSAQTIVADGSVELCSGNSVGLSVQIEAGVTYEWQLDGNAIVGNSNSIIATIPGVYSLDMSNACGIISSTNTINISSINDPLTFNLTATGNTTFCDGESVTLSTDLQSNGNYQWKLNGNNIGINSNTFTATVAGIYSLEISNSCGTLTSTNSIETIVTPIPVSGLITIVGNTELCGPETSTLSIQILTGANYQWKKDGNNIGTNQNTLLVNEAGIYTVEISNSCGTVTSLNSIEISITPQPIAGTISTNGSTTICSGSNLELSVLSQTGVNYQWKLDGNNIGINSTTLLANTAGVYSIEFSNSCGTIVSANTISIIVNSAPTPSIISANGSTTICSGSSIELSVAPQVGVNYQWKIDGLNTGTNSATLTANAAGIFSVELSNNCGTVVSTNTISATIESAPIVAIISANGNTTFCSGSSLELSVPFQAGVNYQWKQNGSNIGTNSEIINATTSGIYTVEISNNCGTVTSGNSINVTVENLPNSTAIIALGATTFCSGNSVNLTSPLQTGINYQWKLDGNNVGTNTNTFTASQAGTFTLEIFNSCTTLVSSNSITVNLNFAPQSQTINPNGATTICSGSFVELSVLNLPFTNYQWKLNGNNIGTNSSSINANSEGLYTVELSNNCGTTTSSNSIQVNVTVVNANVNVNGPTSFCNGGSVSLSANSGTSYLWSNSSTNQSISVTQTGSYTVSVTNNNCSATSEPIFINVLNVIPPTISASATEICNGTQAIISSSTQTEYQSYNWSNGLNGNTINVSSAGTYFVTVTSTNGCTSISNSVNISIVGPSAPLLSFTGTNIFCEGGSVTLNSSTPLGNSWYLNGIQIVGASGSSLIATQTGNYTTQISGQGCNAISNVIPVIVNPLPTATAGITSQNIGAVTFANNSTNYSTSVWNFGDNTPNSSITNPFHQYLADGTYNVVLTVTNSCGSTSTEITVTVLGTAIEELESQTNFAIYPNPFQSNITLSNTNSNYLVGIVTIFDATGKTISYESLNIGPGNNLQMNVENLAKGIYFIEVKTNEYNKTLKLLKQ